METIMELDDLKTTWQMLDRRLEQNSAIHLQLLRNTKLDKARYRLRPLFWGQVMQILFGLLVMLLAVACWTQNTDVPVLLASGLILHAYGVLTIVMAGITLSLMKGIDYADPIVAIQSQLARLRRFYIINAMSVGLPWWILWLPMVIVVIGLGSTATHLGTAAPAPWFWINVAVGLAGLAATWGFHRWSHQPSRAQLGKRLDDRAAGSSILGMQHLLDEIAEFERE